MVDAKGAPVTEADRKGRLLSSLQALSATLMAILQTRLALVATELEEEKQRLLAILGWGAVAILMGTVASVFLAGFITVLFWDTHPLLVLGGLTLGFVLACAWAVGQVRQAIHGGGDLLAASLAELQADRDALAEAAARGRAQSDGATAASTDASVRGQ
ncbi:MAG: phage holin family protein [Burkholderiales bacterium]|jgi:uncharacterized membrane protein YqjE|nr:MAG: phage holin family protein [Burkholderiales bacterium]